jgi:hypothetical protein
VIIVFEPASLIKGKRCNSLSFLLFNIGNKKLKNISLIEGILILIISVVGLSEGVRLTLQRSSAIVIRDVLGPSLFVILLSSGLLIVAIIHFIVIHRKVTLNEKTSGNTIMSVKVIGMISVLAGYIVLIRFFGYFMPSIPFFLLEFRIAGVRSWRRNLVLAPVTAIAFYIIFVKLCNMPLPRGIF